jgi:hypothetical protein
MNTDHNNISAFAFRKKTARMYPPTQFLGVGQGLANWAVLLLSGIWASMKWDFDNCEAGTALY